MPWMHQNIFNFLTQMHRLPKKKTLAVVVFCCAFVLLNLVIQLQSLTLKNRTLLRLTQECSPSKKRLHLYSSVKHFTVSHISVEELRP